MGHPVTGTGLPVGRLGCLVLGAQLPVQRPCCPAPASQFGCLVPSSQGKHRVPCSKCPAPGAQCPGQDSWCLAPGIGQLVGCPIPSSQCWVSSTEYPVPSAKCPVLSAQFLVPRLAVQCQVPVPIPARCPVLDVTFPVQELPIPSSQCSVLGARSGCPV